MQSRTQPNPQQTPAIVWAIASAHGNYSTASKGRVGVLVSVGAAALAGAGVAWMNWLLNVGSGL